VYGGFDRLAVETGQKIGNVVIIVVPTN